MYVSSPDNNEYQLASKHLVLTVDNLPRHRCCWVLIQVESINALQFTIFIQFPRSMIHSDRAENNWKWHHFMHWISGEALYSVQTWICTTVQPRPLAGPDRSDHWFDRKASSVDGVRRLEPIYTGWYAETGVHLDCRLRKLWRYSYSRTASWQNWPNSDANQIAERKVRAAAFVNWLNRVRFFLI